MSKYIRNRLTPMNKVYIIWERYPSQSDMFPRMENPRKLIDVHRTMEGAVQAEGLLIRTAKTYYSIEVRETLE